MTTVTRSPAGTQALAGHSLLEGQIEAYKRDGFIIIEDGLQGDELSRVQAAFEKVQAVTRLDWEAGRSKGKGVSENGEYYASGTFHGRKYFDIYPLHLLEQDDACVEMIAHPQLFPFLSASVGEDVQTATIQVRVLEPQTAQDAQEEGGYVNWHRDHSSDEEWRFSGRPLNTKVLVYLTDVGEDDGCTACVPGSHLWDRRPDHLVYKGMGGGDNQATKVCDQRDMPGMVAAEVKAGSAFLFNTRLWHTTLPNTGDRDRWCVITLYCPFYQKQPGVTIEAAVALEAAGQLNTPERRQLFGLDMMSTSKNPYKRLAQHDGSDTDDRMFKGVRPPTLGEPLK
ncbi:MAG: phytanoyl-CoA dioxygenase family protein [Candidatus Latescibacterota bacterium]|nr:phytanoyl-CoA dioxygenase family protein [Candidatus Latescibacterota bacterium]